MNEHISKKPFVSRSETAVREMSDNHNALIADRKKEEDVIKLLPAINRLDLSHRTTRKFYTRHVINPLIVSYRKVEKT